MNKFATTLFALVALSMPAQAHQIWIEQPDGANAVIRFGEFGENLREASPGLLDKFVKPTGTLLSTKGERSSDTAKFANGFTLPFKALSGESIVAEELHYPFYTWNGATSWFHPAARLITSFAEQQPKLVLDLVPAGKPGRYKLFFKGQPRAKTKVTLVTQSGWSKEGQTDEQGIVEFNMPWKGTYVAEVSINDRTPGERAGANGPEKYDGVSYVTTTTYMSTDGLPTIPAGEPATPGK